MKTGYALSISAEDLGTKNDKRSYIDQNHYSSNLTYASLAEFSKAGDPRVFVELPACQSHVDVWVDALLMKEIIDRVCSNDHTINLDTDNNVLEISWQRYTMNLTGYHIGYETWIAKFPIREKRTTESNKMILESLVGTGNCTYYNHVVLLSEMDVVCTDAPDTETCECDDPDECQCELYVNPIDSKDFDFGYQEADSQIVDVVKNTQACWKFGGEGHLWQMWVDGRLEWEMENNETQNND